MAFIPLNICHAVPYSGSETETWVLANVGEPRTISSYEVDINAASAARQVLVYNPPFGSYYSQQTFYGTGQGCWAIRFYDGNCTPSSEYFIILYGIDDPDSDGDGIDDEYDLYPYDTNIYTAGISSILYNSTTGELVAGVITVNNGDKFAFGSIPSDLSGYTSESIDGDITMDSASELQANLENIVGDLNLTKISGGLDVQADGTFNFDDFVSSTTNLSSLIINNITADNPAVGTATNMETGQASTGSETDNEALRKIVDNTKSSNDNQNRIADYLKINNDLLARISRKTDSSGVVISNGSGPTAAEIGEAVKDNLIDSSQTHDSTDTDNIAEVDTVPFFTNFKTTLHNTYMDFKLDLEQTEFYNLADNLLPDIPSGGSSSLPVNIGSWGESNDQFVTFELLDYVVVWDSLKYILPILTLWSCLKILVLKHT